MHHDERSFPDRNRGYARAFRPDRLTVGLVVPIERYPAGPVPSMERHLERVQLAEQLGYTAVWLRDVPFDVASFGDAGQIYDPFVYLGLLAGRTEHITLGVASIILPLRHPANVAKAAATADVLSGGRLVLGVASGDRPDEFPAMAVPFEERGSRFRESFEYIERMAGQASSFDSPLGSPRSHMNLVPKPVGGRLPMLITGSSRQDPDWIARNGDGWMLYPRDPSAQGAIIAERRARSDEAGSPNRPVMQPLYIDLDDDPDGPPRPLHLGYRIGVRPLIELIRALEMVGVNHVALNLRFNSGPTEATLHRLAEELLPEFNTDDEVSRQEAANR